MPSYKEVKSELTNNVAIERTNKDGTVSFIPTDPANTDYQRYLRWLEDPNADEFTTEQES